MDFVWELRKRVHLGLESAPKREPSHHQYSVTDIDTFNSIPNKIMVVRDPIDRAKSGIAVNFNPDFHGKPTLQYIDWDMIDYIIPFEDISNKYLNGFNHNVGITHEAESSVVKEVDRVMSESDPKQEGVYWTTWSLDDFDFTREIETYNLVLKTKEKLPPSLWIELLSKVTACNIPSKHLLKW